MPLVGEEKRDYQRDLMRQRRRAERDIAIPEVVDPQRKASCAEDVVKFARTYFPELCYFDLCEMHMEVYGTIQRLIRYGGRQALAAPRGHGKDTMLTIAILWAALYGYLKYILLIAPNMPDAKEMLEGIQTIIETNETLQQDFPEVCAPALALERQASRAKSQTHNGQFTRMVWSKDEIVFPTVDGSAASGCCLQPAGIDGTLRGFIKNGRRPDFFLLCELENDETAKSETMQRNYEDKLDKALSQIGGPGKPVSGVLLCTIIKPVCLAEKYTNPEKKPAWHGKRFKALIEPPDHESLWDEYIELRRSGMMDNSDPEGEGATAFYMRQRKEMDQGAVVVWPANYVRGQTPKGSPIEVSALQHLYNIISDDGIETFMSELQNEPIEEDLLSGLTERSISERCSGYDPMIVPDNTKFITEGIDIGAHEIHFVVIAHQEDGTGYVIDYGRIMIEAPAGNLVKKDSEARKALEARITDALHLRKAECDQGLYQYATQAESPKIDLTFVDSGYLPNVVYAFCRKSGRQYQPVKGFGTLQGQIRYTNVKKRTKAYPKVGSGWHTERIEAHRTDLFKVDADHWKRYTHERFLQDEGTPAACMLHGREPKVHRMFASHIVAEAFDMDVGRWVKVKRYNHWLDCMVYAHAAAGALGLNPFGRPRRGAKTIKIAPGGEKHQHGRIAGTVGAW